jgi:hypothetical protein
MLQNKSKTKHEMQRLKHLMTESLQKETVDRGKSNEKPRMGGKDPHGSICVVQAHRATERIKICDQNQDYVTFNGKIESSKPARKRSKRQLVSCAFTGCRTRTQQLDSVKPSLMPIALQYPAFLPLPSSAHSISIDTPHRRTPWQAPVVPFSVSP